MFLQKNMFFFATFEVMRLLERVFLGSLFYLKVPLLLFKKSGPSEIIVLVLVTEFNQLLSACVINEFIYVLFFFAGFTTASGHMAIVLLDPSEAGDLTDMLGDTPASLKHRKAMLTGSRYKEHAKVVFPWLHNRGAFEG